MSTNIVSDRGQPVDAGAQVELARPQKSGLSGLAAIGDSSGVSADSQTKAGVVQPNGEIVDATPGEPRDLYSYLVYVPSSAPARVYGGRQTIYDYPGDEAMRAVVNRNLENIKWIQIVAWRNDTSAAQQYQVSYKTELKITQGSEINAGFNLGASYEGLSVGVDYSQKTFKSTETTSSKTITLTVNVPAYSEVVFYQKQYEFSEPIFFINDAWGQEWNVGPWGGYNPLTTKNVVTQIMAEEYLTASGALPAGPGKMQVTTVGQAPGAGITRKRENTTERCKNKLSQMGL